MIYDNNHFDLVIDKGTLDALMVIKFSINKLHMFILFIMFTIFIIIEC